MTTIYQEGAHGRCYLCGRPRSEHRGRRLACPKDRNQHDTREWVESRAGGRVAPKEPCP